MRALVCIAAVLAGCGGGPLCTPKDINEALKKQAAAGGLVEIGACMVNGAIDVPAGARLKGQSPDLSIISSDGKTPPLTVHADRGSTEISGLQILSTGPIGLIARGHGGLSLDTVTVQASLGIAIGAEDLGTLNMKTVHASGPVTASNAASIPNGVTSKESATHGIVLVNVSGAELDDVTSAGFATAGALLIQSDVHWKGGGASDNLALGAGIEGGHATLENVSVCRTLQGDLLLPAFGFAFTASASVSSNALKACENQGYGVLQDGGDAMHTAIDLEDNANAAFWAQHTSKLELTGKMTGNHFAAVVLVEAKNSVIHDAQISNTVLATRVFHGTGMAYQVGDGVQLVKASDATVLRDVMITNNDRTGILLELQGATAKPMTFDQVTVSVSSSTQHGAIAQHGALPDGWDVGITRIGTQESIDQSFSGMLDFVKAVGPCNMPRPTDLSILAF